MTPPDGHHAALGAHRVARPGVNCLAIERAARADVLMDNAAYFSAVRRALEGARRSVLIVGWTFDPRMQLEPLNPDDPGEIGPLLKRLSAERPDLEIRVLAWDAAAVVSLGKRLMPQRGHLYFACTRVRFALDKRVPYGATLHQKLVVVDDAVAFVSGADFSGNRWDRAEHLDEDAGRRMPGGGLGPPRHTMSLSLTGPVARAVGDVARQRWSAVTDEEVPAVEGAAEPVAQGARTLHDVPVALARTVPADTPDGEVRENEALFLDAIAAARGLIYAESQYLTSTVIRDALARRLAEPDGPEVVLVTAKHAPSAYDRAVMDAQRRGFLAALRQADAHGRFHAFYPLTRGGTPISVHSKLMIVDDRFLRIGSSNLANRSLGYDVECDAAVELDPGDPQEAAVFEARMRVLAHFLGCAPGEAARAVRGRGGMGAAIAALDPEGRRLAPLWPVARDDRGTSLSKLHLGDPRSASEAWRPWRRRA